MFDIAYRKETLDNGVTLVMERHPTVRSLCIGVWVRVGTRFENPGQNGISHFLEHMLFKGTRDRTPLQVAAHLESLGGELNAFTDREYTCYHATVLTEHRAEAFDILSDILLRSTVPVAEVERERKVLIQEMSMADENPEDSIANFLMRTVWDKSPLGMPVLGTRQTVAGLQRKHLVRYWDDYYRSENVVISVAGNIEFDEIRDLAEKQFVFEPIQKTLAVPQMQNRYLARHRAQVQNVEQLHLMVAFEGVSFRDPQRFDALVLSCHFGGGMSSRLFQEIREKAALAYTVDCDSQYYSDAGLFAFYAALNHGALKKCLGILSREVEAVVAKPLTEEEINRIKSQIRGSILLGSEYVETRQEVMGRNEIMFGRYVPIDEVIYAINQVTPETVQSVAARLFKKEKESAVAIGRKKLTSKQLSLYS